MIPIKVSKLILGIDCPYIIPAHKVRGYFSNLFKNEPLVHQHKSDGSTFYKYPLIQFKRIGFQPHIIGINKGADFVECNFRAINSITIKGCCYNVVGHRWSVRNYDLGIVPKNIEYKFQTPWIALNHDNYARYQHLPQIDQITELKRILTANLISLSKSLGYEVEEQIIVSDIKLESKHGQIHDNGMKSFKGTFSVNFEIPELIGIGKSVSRGYGAVSRVINKEKESTVVCAW